VLRRLDGTELKASAGCEPHAKRREREAGSSGGGSREPNFDGRDESTKG
jgi:hypothetical protein